MRFSTNAWTALLGGLLLWLPLATLAQIPEGYYDTAAGLQGAALKAALHNIISDHNRYPYTSTSTDVWDILKAADEDPANPENVILIYTGRSTPKSLNSGEAEAPVGDRWNREHLWSKSHGFPDEADTAFTDCHHLRAADESVNSSRNTLDFDNGGTQHAEADSCYYDSDSWEPREAVKGDIARTMFYMTVRYDPGYHTDNTTYDLELVDSTATQTYTPVFGKLSTLMQWHAQDPVDAVERHRNEVIYAYQGNRNPFVDHPEWAAAIFNEQLGSNTRVGFTTSSRTVEEDIGTLDLDLVILNPSPEFATECDIQLISTTGSADDLDGFESASLTFPPGSSAIQTLTLTIVDDLLAEERETFQFALTNISGGDSAVSNGNDRFSLTINPSDQSSAMAGLVISEVMDGNRSGGSPKFLEFTNTLSSSLDIGTVSVWRGSNGDTPGPVVTIPPGTVLPAGASWVIAYNTTDMLNAGFSQPDQTSGGINGNGNDVYELRTAAGALVDAFGIAGTSTAWYENMVVTRKPHITGQRSNYDPAEWDFVSLSVGEPVNGSPGSPGWHQFDVSSLDDSALQPAALHPLMCYPNPFNASTEIKYRVDHETAPVRLRLFDLKGQLIWARSPLIQSRGTYTLRWQGQNSQGQDAPAGLYFLFFENGPTRVMHKLTLLP